MEKTNKQIESQKLDKDQANYRNTTIEKLVNALDTRNQAHDEFDDMTFEENFVFNRELALAKITPRKNPTDVNIVSGTARAKMKSIASAIVKMNLDTAVLAFDKNEDEDQELSNVLTNMLKKSKEIDNDQEKMLLRVLGLLEQGTVHVGETWTPIVQNARRLKNAESLDVANGFEGAEIEEDKIIDYKCERRLYDNLEIIPGNIKEYYLEKQPFMARRIIMNYDEAATTFGKWKEWKHVVKGGARALERGQDSLPYNNFRLYDLEEEQVEVIYYEDLPNREYNIFINGVMMLPMKFPMPWEWDGYSFIKQVLDPINSNFYYGRSLMSELRFATDVLDRMLQMLINKTQQSIKPAMANNTGKMLSPRILDAGTMTAGIDGSRLKQLTQHQGVTSSEFAMYSELKSTIDMNSVSAVFQGQQPGSGQTATAILEMQRQTQQSLAPIVLSVTLMEEKADYLRLYNQLSNWTKPIDTKVNEAKTAIVETYRKVNISDADIGGKNGNLKIEMLDTIPTQEERKDYSMKNLKKEMRSKRKTEKEVRIILPILKSMKYRFFLRCNPSDRASDNLNKVLFREMMEQGFNYFGPQELNMDYFKKKWALAWGNNPMDVFANFSMNALEGLTEMQGRQGTEDMKSDNQNIKAEGMPEQRKSGTGIAGGLAKAGGSKNEMIANV